MSSTMIDTLSFGRGELDPNTGTWEVPCWLCARAWEKAHPEDGPCWPFSDETLDSLRTPKPV